MTIMLRFFVLLSLLTVGMSTFAQAPAAINYQGVVRDGNGQLINNAALSAQFTIKENGPAGATIYRETHNITTNDYGLFTALIGQGTVQGGNFSQIDWGGASMFLKVEVDNGSGWIDLGTTQLVSVPYALYAKEAGNGGSAYQAGNGIDITGNTISNTAPDRSVTLTGSGATTVSGTYPNFTISSTDQVDDADNNPSNEIQNLTLSGNTLSISQGNSVTLPTGTSGDNWGSQVVQSDATLEGDGTANNRLSIARQGAGNGEILKWDGTAWIPAADDNTTYSAGSGLTLTGTTFNNTGDTDASDDVTQTTQSGGDVSGTFQNMTVEALRGQPVAATSPAGGDVLKWNGSSWEAGNDIVTTDTSHWEKTGQYLYTLTDSVGIGVAAPQAALHIDSGGSFFIGDTMATPSGNVFLYDANKAAFRVGGVSNNKWDTDSIGNYSFASGIKTKATGLYSIAFGDGTIASGKNSTALGSGTSASGLVSTAMGGGAKASGLVSTAMGYDTDASGTYSIAMGSFTEASGNYSTAMGYITTASGGYSTAMGRNTIASGDYSTTMGKGTTASATEATAMGSNTVASQPYATAMGLNTTASGSSATAMGFSTTASANEATAMGRNTSATGIVSTAMGNSSEASGNNSTAMGSNTTASALNAIAMGEATIASGYNSTAMGSNTAASGNYSTAMGQYAIASGYNSVAMGISTNASGFNSTAMVQQSTASGSNSIAMGVFTTAPSYCETVVGTYNTSYTPAGGATTWNASDRLFVIGNGMAAASTSNAMVVLKNGNTGIGNSNPQELLHVGSTTGDGIRIGTIETLLDGGGNLLLVGGSNSGVSFAPEIDNVADLGRPTQRWDDIYATNGVIQTSDGRDKESILTLDYGLQTLMQLKPVSFVWKEGYTNGGRKLGFLAQDLLNTIPEVVKTEDLVHHEDGTSEIVQLERYGVYYSDLIPVLVKSIQEQNSLIEAMQQQILDLQQTVEQLQH